MPINYTLCSLKSSQYDEEKIKLLLRRRGRMRMRGKDVEVINIQDYTIYIKCIGSERNL